MIDRSALKAIREAHNHTLELFAHKLGYKAEYIRDLEDPSQTRVVATHAFVRKLREEFDLHDAPLTVKDIEDFANELHRLRDLIDYGEMQRAKEMMPKLAKRAEQSCHRSLQCLHDLYVARYYHIVGNTRVYTRTMNSLGRRQSDFTELCNFLYHYQIAIQALTEHRLHEAHEAFDKAEKIDKEYKWCGLSFNYHYGLCLSNMGYAAKAIRYFEQAQHKAKEDKNFEGKTNRRFDIYIECWLARNYSKIGHVDKAFFILNERIDYETKRGSTVAALGYVYHNLGEAYHMMGNFNEALEHYEQAFKYHEERSEPYLDNLYHKAITLIECNRVAEAMDCVSKGLRMNKTRIWTVLFMALMHSVALSDPKSLEYMEKVAIPDLLELGQYEEVINHLETVSKFYKEAGDLENALEHAGAMYEIQKQIYHDRVERGV